MGDEHSEGRLSLDSAQARPRIIPIGSIEDSHAILALDDLELVIKNLDPVHEDVVLE
jgi:hypothetical protein